MPFRFHSAPRPLVVLAVPCLIVAALAGAGCTQNHASPTERAMARAGQRNAAAHHAGLASAHGAGRRGAPASQDHLAAMIDRSDAAKDPATSAFTAADTSAGQR